MNKKLTSRYGWIFLLIVLTIINLIAARIHYRIDLTREKRYTLSEATKTLLKNLDEPVQIDFFLEGDLKTGIHKLSKSAEELLQEFSEYSDGKVQVHAFDPLAGQKESDSAKAYFLDSLAAMGIQTMTQVAQTKKGEEQSQRLVIPGAILRYKHKTIAVNLLKGVQVSREDQPKEQLYTNAETLLEYKFASAIDKITRRQVPAVGYVMGNGEPLDFRVYELIQDLRANYRFGIVRLDSLTVIPKEYDALVIVKPVQKFTEREKLALDQYLMHGGHLLWAIDNLHAEMDSLRSDRGTIAYDLGLDLDDLFFRYGVRINRDLVEDIQCANINLVVGMQGDKPQIELLPWPYFPLLNGSLTHPISKNLDPVYARFANSIDTVKASGIQKTVLLQTSAHARTVGTPAIISFESVKQASDPGMFNRPDIPVAVLLEGKFNSLFANRISGAMSDSLGAYYKTPFLAAASSPTSVIVCSDGDLVMNELTQQGRPMPMGLNKDINFSFANPDFVSNCIDYLVNPSHILETRAKDFTLRLLDPVKVESDRGFWQFINIVLPVLLVILGGYIYQSLRRRKYQG